MSVVRANVPNASLHPLLYNTGTVAAAAGSFQVKRGDESKTTVEPKVCDQALVQPKEVSRDQVRECEREREFHSHLQADMDEMKSNLMNELEKLEKREELMWNLLSDAYVVREGLEKECEREQEARSILQSELSEKSQKLKHCEELLMECERKREFHRLLQADMDEMKSNLLYEVEKLEKREELMWNLLSDAYVVREGLEKECEREQEARSILQSELNEKMEKLKHCEELLMVSLAELEEKHQKAVETIAQLETEKSDLTDQVETLREAMEEIGNELSNAYIQYGKRMKEQEQERETLRIVLQAEKDMIKTLTDNKDLLKVSIDELEEKHQKAVENITQLETEKSDLTDQVETLREAMEEIGNKLNETYRQYGELMKEREREGEAHRILQAENKDMKTLTANQELLKDSLAKSGQKLQKSMETITQLDAENSDLTQLVMSQREAIEHMQNQLSEAYREHDKLNNECKSEQEAHSMLECEFNQTKEKLKLCEELLLEREREAQSILQEKNNMMKMLTQKEESLKVFIDELQVKHQKAVENITHLETEKSHLMDQVVSLQDELCKSQKKADNLTNECERERESHSILQSELNQTKDDFKYFEKNIMVSLAELKEKHQKAVENITQLETEKSDLTDQVETLREAMEEIGNEFSETYRQYGELINERERERETYRILQAENEEMKSLTANLELLKDSLAKSEEKLRESMETAAQLDAKNSKQEDLVMSLKEAMQNMQNQLSDAYREREKLNNECKSEQEAHSMLDSELKKAKEKLKLCEELLLEQERERQAHSVLLQAEKDMMKTLTHNEELLKVTIDELGKKHQKAVENITQLEVEKSRLIDQVVSLQHELCESQKKADNLTDECERKRESHSILQSELNQAKDDFKYFEKNMTVSLAELEEKHQKAVENITQLETEKSDLTDQVETLREAMEEIGNEFSETYRQYGELINWNLGLRA
ncbi:uncharacterized protein Hap1MRO34_017074 [Clarias gariepinus]